MSIRFGLWYDFRNPPQFRQDPEALYGAILEQAARAEALGWDDVWVSEHHFAEDDYTPSPLVLLGAIAARTRRMRLGTSVLLLPLHDPVRVAEDTATLDVLSGGRVDLGVGLGYAPHEFTGFGLSPTAKRSRYEEGVEILQRLLAGERFTFEGKHFVRREVDLRPRPLQSPFRPWLGGGSDAAIDRAARIGAHYVGVGSAVAPYRRYAEQLEKNGRPRDQFQIAGGYGGFEWLHVSENPEKRWNEAEKHFICQYDLYVRWTNAAGGDVKAPADGDALRAQGVRIVRPAEAAERIAQFIADSGVDRYYQWTLPPGLPPEWADEHIELMARDVFPEVRKRLAG